MRLPENFHILLVAYMDYTISEPVLQQRKRHFQARENKVFRPAGPFETEYLHLEKFTMQKVTIIGTDKLKCDQ